MKSQVLLLIISVCNIRGSEPEESVSESSFDYKRTDAMMELVVK